MHFSARPHLISGTNFLLYYVGLILINLESSSPSSYLILILYAVGKVKD